MAAIRQHADADDIEVAAVVKGRERYVILFNGRTRAEALRTIGRWASAPDLSFSWYDAAALSNKMRADWACKYSPPDTDTQATGLPPAALTSRVPRWAWWLAAAGAVALGLMLWGRM